MEGSDDADETTTVARTMTRDVRSTASSRGSGAPVFADAAGAQRAPIFARQYAYNASYAGN